MHPVLHEHRLDGHLGQEPRELVAVEAGQARCPHCSRRDGALDGPVRLDVPRSGMMQEHQVDEAEPQLGEGLLDGLVAVAELARVELRDDEDVLAGDARLAHRPAHLRLVAVDVRRVDEPHATCERGPHRVDAGLVVEAVGAQPVGRHGHAVAERHPPAGDVEGGRHSEGGGRRALRRRGVDVLRLPGGLLGARRRGLGGRVRGRARASRQDKDGRRAGCGDEAPSRHHGHSRLPSPRSSSFSPLTIASAIFHIKFA